MSHNTVIEFGPRLRKKREKAHMKKRIANAGWIIDGDVQNTDSDVVVYLMDCDEAATILYGCKKTDFPELGSKEIIEWRYFLGAWHVIADPDMGFDQKHKEVTMGFALRALPGLAEWPAIATQAFSTKPSDRAHIFVISDRDDIEGPMAIIVAHSTAPVMNTESVQAILDSYYKAQ